MADYQAINAAQHDGDVAAIKDVGPLTVVVRQHAGTTTAEAWVGSKVVTAFATHTYHTDSAMQVATTVVEHALADLLRPLIETSALRENCQVFDPKRTYDDGFEPPF